MPKTVCNGVEIAYQEYGNTNDPAMLMVQGLSMPLAGWPAAMIDALVEQGFRIVMFDNRDVGHSQTLDELGLPGMTVQFLKSLVGLRVNSPYQLTDMMHDATGLLDALGIEMAHVVGVSMGGMISQLLAIHAPHRVRSLTSLMSTTGNRSLPRPAREITRHILSAPKSPSAEERRIHSRKTWALIGSPGYKVSAEEREEFLDRIYARGMTAAGTARQTLAIMAAPSRVPALRQVTVPTLVIHGEADPLVPLECGIDTANAIPGSKLATIPGMGHDLPQALIPRLVRLISEHAVVADASGQAE